MVSMETTRFLSNDMSYQIVSGLISRKVHQNFEFFALMIWKLQAFKVAEGFESPPAPRSEKC